MDLTIPPCRWTISVTVAEAAASAKSGIFSRNGAVAPPLEPVQGPIIKKQQREGEGHQRRLREQSEQHEPKHREVREGTGAPLLPHVSPEGEDPEEGREHVLALRGPRHRLHLGGMQGEQRGDEGAAPRRARHAPHDEKQEGAVGGMKENVHQMVSGRVEAEERHIRHVGEPGQRMPVGRPTRREGPDGAAPGESGGDRAVADDVVDVVDGDKGVVADREKHGDGDGEERQPRQKIAISSSRGFALHLHRPSR